MDLVGTFVVEVGERQARPFLTFCNNEPTPPIETRLCIAGHSLNRRHHEAGKARGARQRVVRGASLVHCRCLRRRQIDGWPRCRKC